VLALLLFPVGAALIPLLFLHLQIGRRQRLLLRAYPDLLAHLVTQLRAGAPTPTAFATAPPALADPLRTEVVELLADLATAPFPAALRRFTDRCDLEPLRHLAAAVEQGEAVGISLLQILEKEEVHALALARQAVRERIQTSAVILAAVTVILLVNGLIIWFTPVAFDLLKLLKGKG
jgi:Flp pilus assembly protein TadB